MKDVFGTDCSCCAVDAPGAEQCVHAPTFARWRRDAMTEEQRRAEGTFVACRRASELFLTCTCGRPAHQHTPQQEQDGQLADQQEEQQQQDRQEQATLQQQVLHTQVERDDLADNKTSPTTAAACRRLQRSTVADVHETQLNCLICQDSFSNMEQVRLY